MLERFFRLKENNTNVRTEVLAGITTFLTMAYIIFVQPSILSGAMFHISTGMNFGAITTATCVSAAIATAIMGIYAKYPIAQAPGMGENIFFVLTVLPAIAAAGFTDTWQIALGIIFISGILFLLLSILGIREMLIDAVSPDMKNGIAVGIGLFIAFIGLQNAGVIKANLSTGVQLSTQFASPDIIIFFFGLFLTSALQVRRVRGSILWGILASTALSGLLYEIIPHLPMVIQNSDLVKDSMLMKQFHFSTGIIAAPPSVSPTFFKMDLRHALSLSMLPFIVIFLFMEVFDTIGTLIGVSEQAGFIKDNKLPRASQALLSDAIGTVAGAALGTSTVTSFIESAAGVEQGGRTGLTSVVTAGLFILALFFSPIIAMVGSYTPITAPALLIVGAMMIQNVRKINWGDYGESIPAFLTIIGIPLTYSIGDGMALGFISYPLIKLLSGQGREVRWLMYVLALILLFYFLFVRSGV